MYIIDNLWGYQEKYYGNDGVKDDRGKTDHSNNDVLSHQETMSVVTVEDEGKIYPSIHTGIYRETRYLSEQQRISISEEGWGGIQFVGI